MRDSAFEQSSIVKIVGKDRLQEVEVRYRGVVSQNMSDYNKRRKLVEKSDLLSALLVEE